MSDVKGQIRLLKMQMKIELNTSWASPTPGGYLKSAKQALEIAKLCDDSTSDTLSECKGVIMQYIRCMDTFNTQRIDLGLDFKNAAKWMHGSFLNDLYQYNPPWVAGLVELYPHVFIIVNDKEWCAWTKLLV